MHEGDGGELVLLMGLTDGGDGVQHDEGVVRDDGDVGLVVQWEEEGEDVIIVLRWEEVID